jgi:hypothetical protein
MLPIRKHRQCHSDTLRIIVLKNKYIKLTYILGMFCPVMVIFNFCRRLHKFTTCVLIVCDNEILILVLFIVKQEDATCIACDLVQHLPTELITMYISSFMTAI